MEKPKPPASAGTSGGLFAFMQARWTQREPEAIPNTVLVCLMKTKNNNTRLVLLKEKWDEWHFLKPTRDEHGKFVNTELKDYKKTAPKRSEEARKNKNKESSQ